MNYTNVISKLKEISSSEKAVILSRFFKTAKGQYGEGDIFIGVTVPKIREIAKSNSNIDLQNLKFLLINEIHEVRLCGFMILLDKYTKAKTDSEKKQIYEFCIEYKRFLNNWDLVDLIVPKLIGDYIFNFSKNFQFLLDLAISKSLWDRRISIISTFYFIKNNEFNLTLKISKILLSDKEDLIHKAVGWMLREVGKRNLLVEESFLKENYLLMPRTMLRYSIEKFEESKRKKYLYSQI